jgi:hypothetical protein
MKKFINKLLFLFIVILFIISFMNINSNNVNENFTPKIKGFYRPLVRKTRLVGEGFYNKTSSNINNLFRKIGIM